MTISSLNGLSSINLNNISAAYNREQQAVRPVVPEIDKEEDSKTFGNLLAEVQKADEVPESGGSAASTMTLADVMPNGSLLVQKVDGDQLIEEKVLDVARIQIDFDLQGMPGQVFRAYMAGMGIATAPAGAIFNAFI
ncbi:hypothetical protein [Selenomonas sp. AB3002]|uniref:hypothetical protein n=1 Tax=Selenomonas sp. AB3002 TaxID=1392502 RepID=UPI0004985D74